METTGDHNKIKELLIEVFKKIPFVIIGNLLCSIAINGFFIPNKMLSGGVSGISILFYYMFTMPTSLTALILNVPLLILGMKKLDKKVLLYTSISIITNSLLLHLTKNIGSLIGLNDVLLGCIFGGVFNGVGMVILYRNKVLQSGVDVVCAIIKRYYNINIGVGLMGFNTTIITISSILFGLKPAMYTIISMFISYQIVDKIQAKFNIKKNVFIVSDKSRELADEIMIKMNRGVTLLEGQGGYTKSTKRMIYCIVSPTEIVKLKTIVSRVDPKAFMTINTVQEVNGNGFKTVGI
ncbi:hypothetical protein CLPU_6c00680 [Gottschalkia purinilytica]|uniref:DUF2179 domain-containing protein n=1 Tax=Gottschalkia purinilytica TaxID=1503 RepID=A0A0L0WAV2_GOTPU|nr:YitT family protein [Gottschalkia purinilytica]KNF08582.1 hypothetical protein CLPU_6c00680 [Gottschalkia purinilytica]